MLSVIRDRLATEVTDLKDVLGASDIPSAEEELKRTPAAFVLLVRERAGRNALMNATSQRVSRTAGVLLAVRNLKSARGDAAREDLEALRTSVRTALLNWEPDSDHEPMSFVGGALLKVSDQVLWWLDEFETAYQARMV